MSANSMLSDMISVAQLELSSLQKHTADTLKENMIKYVADSRKLKLFQVIVDEKQDRQTERVVQYSFDCDSFDNMYIVDQIRYFPLDRSLYSPHIALVEKLINIFNRRREDKAVKLFSKEAFIKVPSCHAVPETFVGALKDTANRIEWVHRWFKHELSDKVCFYATVSRRKNKTFKQVDAIGLINFEEDFRTGKLKIERLQICHR